MYGTENNKVIKAGFAMTKKQKKHLDAYCKLAGQGFSEVLRELIESLDLKKAAKNKT